MPSLCQTAAFFAAQVAILVFANWAGPEDAIGAWFTLWRAKRWLTSAGALALAAILVRWYTLAPWKAVAIAVPTAPVGHVVKKLIVLGPGCPRCDTLAKLTREAADQLGLEYQLEKLTGIRCRAQRNRGCDGVRGSGAWEVARSVVGSGPV